MVNFIKRQSFKQRLWKSLNIVVATATLLNISMVSVWLTPPAAQAAPSANPSADLDQCANDPAPSPNTNGCATSATEWVNGNLGASKSVYYEGDSVPYRMRFENLSLGTHDVIIEWDTTKSGKHALDYLTTYNRTVADANPCLGVSGCGTASTFPIPVDPQVSGAGVTQIPGNFTLYGGTITGVSAYSYPDGTGFSGDKSAQITITFTATTDNPVLAWGGHISHRQDWGAENSAVAISGSPYHMRLIDLDGSGGNQDRSLSADAVIFPGTITIVKQATPESSQSFAFTASPTPLSNFNLVDDGTATNTKVFSNITNFQTYTVTESVPAGWNLSFNTPVCTVTTQNGGSQTANNPSISINLHEGENVTCTFKNDRAAGLVTFEKIVVGGTAQASDWTFTVGGVAGTFHSGDSTTLPTGTYTVTESGPAGYTSQSVAGICSNLNGNSATLTVTQSGGTCTFTNAREMGDLKVIKHVVNDNGGNNVAGEFTMHIQQSNADVVTPFAGSESGVTKTLPTGTYTVSESNLPSGYTQVSIVCDGQTTNSVTVTAGTTKTCTITNTDVAPQLTLVKNVINNNGGTAGVNDFGLTIGGTPVNSGQTLSVNANTPIALNEAGLAGYQFVSLTGTGCPTQLGGTITLTEGQSRTCTITNDDITAQLTVIKHVINDNGGNNSAADFTMLVSGTNVSDPDFPGNEAGTTVSLNAGSYSVSETGPAGYAASYSADCSGSVALGQTKTCTITNDDVASTITLNKVVINNHGGTAGVNDFGLTIGGTPVNSGQTLSVNANQAYALNEAGLTGYAFVSITGDAKCPQVLNGTVTLTEGENVTCTITNDDIQPTLTVYKFVNNNDGGTAVPSDFTLRVSGNNASPSVFNGTSAGQLVTLNAGAYSVTEDAFPGYSPSYSQDCVGTIAVGENRACVVTNTDDTPHLIVIKHVINDNGGNNVAGDFTMFVSATDPSMSQFPGSEGGTNITLDAGSYNVTEQGPAGYAASFNGCSGTIALGQTKTCTITNNDVAPTITLNKVVVNNNGGNAGVNDFGLTIGGTAVTSGQTLSVNANQAYALNEAGLTGYSFVSLTGDAKCPQALNGTVTLTEGENVTCTITNDDQAPTITLIKNVINDNNGTAGANDFGLTIGGTAVNSGQTRTVNANQAYALNEAGLFGYTFVSLTGTDCPTQLGATVTLDEGEDIVCTITNDDIQPLLTVTKVVINDNGGTAQVSDFPLFVDATQVVSGVQNGFNAGDYVVSETTNVNYAATISGDCDANGNVSLSVGQVKACTITNNDIAADISVEKDGPATVQAGDQITYTINWEVPGPGFAVNAMLVDSLPNNVTFVTASDNSATHVYNSANGTVTWDLGDITAPASGSETITVQTNNPEYNGTLVHNEVTFTTDDDEDGDDHDTTIESDFVVSIDKSAPATVQAGSQLVYTLDWEVTGNSLIDSLIITDELPNNVIFLSATPTQTSFVGNELTWDLGAAQPGDSGSISITVQVSSPLQDGLDLVNVAEICGETLRVEHCDDDETTTEVESDFVVTIDKSDNVDPVQAGGQVTYTLTWTLDGNAPINNLVVTDTLPANISFVSANPAQSSLNGNVLTWNLGAHPTGQGNGVITVTVQVNTPLTNGTVLNNVAEICGQSLTLTPEEVIEHCDEDGEITTVSSAPILTIDKTNNVAGFTNPGGQVTYTVTVTNTANANDTAINVVLTDVLPAGFTYTVGGGSTKNFPLGNLAPGQSVVTSYTVTISSTQAAGTYTNTATAQADNHGPVADTSNVEVRIPQVLGATPEVDLEIIKSVNPTMTNPGKIVTYTLTVRNIGNADATNVVVTDTLPNGFTFVEGGGQSKTFVIGTLKANHERVINYEVRVGSDVEAGTYKNTAVLTADGLQPEVAQADVEVRVPRVLGLATTGVGLRDYVIFTLGLSTLALALYAISRLRRQHDSAAV